jgi:ubiquinone/menaquinone biosynthesis C-methylase UbiE
MNEKQLVQEIFTDLAPHYEEAVDSELNAFWGWSYHRFLDELIKRTNIKPNQRILDIATGTSVIPKKILDLEIPGIHIIGQDITESMLRHGKKNFSQEHLGKRISLTCNDAMALPFADSSFDLVVSGLASHHMVIPLMLAEIKRVLKPGGVLSIIDVGSSPIWEMWIFKGIARLIAFSYFIFKENLTRAWAEAASVTNLRTPEGWELELSSLKFHNISIKKIPSRWKFLPEPLSILCNKSAPL